MGKRLYRDIEIRGVVYPTVQAAAQAFGITPKAVTLAISKGTTHRIGTGAVGPEPMPVRVRGKLYPDAGAAAKALGLTRPAIYAAISEAREDRVGLAPVYNVARSKPITIAGMAFPSMASASRALGFQPGFIAKALKRGSKRGQERILAAAMALKAQMDGQGGVVLAGQSWPTGRAAAEALAISPGYLANLLKSPEGRDRLARLARDRGVAA